MEVEDFSHLANEAGRGGFSRLRIGSPGKEPVSLHNDRFDFNDLALPTGAAVFADIILFSHPSGGTR